MIDQRLIRAAAAAEKAIPLADIHGLQRRGARLRKQRMTAVAGACAVLLGCGSLVVAARDEPRVDPPVSPPRPNPTATPWPESISWTGRRLPPGTYSLATGEDAPV